MGLDMKNVTKGIVAAGLGATLLVGGAGTVAVWTENVTVPGGAINAGHMNLVTDATNTGCGAWTLDTGESVPSTYTAGDPLVPGDVLTRNCAYTIQAVGNHLRATVAVSAVNFSGASADFGGKLTATVSALKVNGSTATSFTDANNGQALTATVSVTFDSTAGNGTEDMSTVLDAITVTATQVHS
jgi:alternate signal-mediated exported protein